MLHINKGAWAESFSIKIILDFLLLYIGTIDNIIECFIKVLQILKHHRATLNMKMFKKI